MNEQSGSGQSVGGDVEPSEASDVYFLDEARMRLGWAIVERGNGDTSDPVVREILAAVDAIDRARRILREGR